MDKDELIAILKAAILGAFVFWPLWLPLVANPNVKYLYSVLIVCWYIMECGVKGFIAVLAAFLPILLCPYFAKHCTEGVVFYYILLYMLHQYYVKNDHLQK